MATKKITKPAKTLAKSRATSSAVSVRKSATKTRRKVEEPMSEMSVENSDSRMSGMPKLPISRKTAYIILLAIGVAVLLYAANKYLVVAWVDKMPVTVFEYYSTLSKRYGKDVSEELIVQKLLESEAKAKGIVVSDEELNSEIKKIEDQQGGADKLQQILTAQNITQDEFHRLVKLQLMRSKLFADGAMVTDGEVDQYITENKDAFAPTTDANGVTTDPKTDQKLRDSIKEQLQQQKTNASFSAWLQGARQSDRVQTH
jgi:parvulin-like peptidyl-prolyl isomerase